MTHTSTKSLRLTVKLISPRSAEMFSTTLSCFSWTTQQELQLKKHTLSNVWSLNAAFSHLHNSFVIYLTWAAKSSACSWTSPLDGNTPLARRVLMDSLKSAVFLRRARSTSVNKLVRGQNKTMHFSLWCFKNKQKICIYQKLSNFI